MHGHTNALRVLLKHGARVDLRDKKGKRPIDLARTKRYKDIVEILKKAEAAATDNHRTKKTK